MPEKAVRKTAVKRAVRRTTTKVAPRKTAVRKTDAAPVRKAPSRNQSASARRPSKVGIALLVLCLLIAGAGVGIGYSDAGAIDVSSVIASRKQNASPEEQEVFKTVPVQQAQTGVTNGGLVGQGKSPLVPSNPLPEVANASSTASSTEEVSDETESDSAPEEESEVDEVSKDETVPPEPETNPQPI